MKYIYYILGIVIIITLLTAFKLSNFKVEVQEPAIVINDRIISEPELEVMLKSWSYTNHMIGVIDALITNELLIQEAVKEGINKEESFRLSVESYYEQSLIKILIDRKFQSFKPEVSQAMVDRYVDLSDKTIEYTKLIYKNSDDAAAGKIQSSLIHKNDFQDLSADLKFIFLNLSVGKISPPMSTTQIYDASVGTSAEVSSFRIDAVSPSPDAHPESDIPTIQEFCIEQKKQQMFNQWMEKLKKNADIQILTKKNLS